MCGRTFKVANLWQGTLVVRMVNAYVTLRSCADLLQFLEALRAIPRLVLARVFNHLLAEYFLRLSLGGLLTTALCICFAARLQRMY